MENVFYASVRNSDRISTRIGDLRNLEIDFFIHIAYTSKARKVIASSMA